MVILAITWHTYSNTYRYQAEQSQMCPQCGITWLHWRKNNTELYCHDCGYTVTVKKFKKGTV